MELSLEEYVNKYINLVKSIATNYANKIGSKTDIQDLYQIGCLGLVKSYFDYDSSKGTMSTYAYCKIRYAVLNYISENNFITYVPVNMVCYSRKAHNENEKCILEKNREATLDELRDAISSMDWRNIKLTDEFLKSLIELNSFHIKCNTLSYEKLVEEITKSDDNNDNYDDVNKSNLMRGDEGIEDKAIDNVMIQEILQYIETLTDDEQIIIKYLFGLDGYPVCSYRELAKIIGVRFQTVSNRYHKILKKIQENFNI